MASSSSSASTSASASSPVILLAVTLENFKTFAPGIHRIPLPRGFSCITGANGVGKSNLLDAVCFAIGDAPARLRVKSLAELSGSPGLRTHVEVTVQQHGGTTVRLASAIVDGVRFFLLNGTRVPKHRFDETLSGLGLLLGGSCVWRISQTDRKASMTPDELHDAVCETSGTKVFNGKKSAKTYQ